MQQKLLKKSRGCIPARSPTKALVGVDNKGGDHSREERRLKEI
jgi:hypothetical protein